MGDKELEFESINEDLEEMIKNCEEEINNLRDSTLKRARTVKNQLISEKNNLDNSEEFPYTKELKKIKKLIKRKNNKYFQKLIKKLNEIIKKLSNLTNYQLCVDRINDDVYYKIKSYYLTNEIDIRFKKDKKLFTISKEEKMSDEEESLSIEDEEYNEDLPGLKNKNFNYAHNYFLDSQKDLPDPIENLKINHFESEKNIYYFEFDNIKYDGDCKFLGYVVKTYQIGNNKIDFLEEITIFENNFTKKVEKDFIYLIKVISQNEEGFSKNNKDYYLYPISKKRESQKLLINSLNEEIQIPLKTATNLVSCKKRKENLWEIKLNEQINLKFIDACSSTEFNSLTLLNNGMVLEWGLTFDENEGQTDNKEKKKKEIKKEEELNSKKVLELINVNHMCRILDKQIIRSVNTGTNFSGALTCQGELYTWGFNEVGQLGQNDFKTRKKPCLIKNTEYIKEFYCSYKNCAMTDFKKNTYIWGKNMSKKFLINSKKGLILKQQTKPHQNFPRKIDIKNLPIKNIKIGDQFYLIQTLTNDLYVLGDNKNGQLGFDTNNEILPFIDTAYFLKEVGKIIFFAVGKNFSIVKNKNGFFGFGSNEFGQIMKGFIGKDFRVPVEIDFGGVDEVFCTGFSTVKVYEECLEYFNGDFKCGIGCLANLKGNFDESFTLLEK